MLRRPLALTALCALALGACGGGAGNDQGGGTAARKQPHPPVDSLALPTDVPLRATGRADAEQARVVRGWANALRRGDVRRATSFWALPATVQNGTPVLRLASRDDVRIFNGSLTCGAVVTAAGAAPGGYTIVRFRLTERPGGACGTGAGHLARTAIQVRGGKIVAWYRLPEGSDKAQPREDPKDLTTV